MRTVASFRKVQSAPPSLEPDTDRRKRPLPPSKHLPIALFAQLGMVKRESIALSCAARERNSYRRRRRSTRGDGHFEFKDSVQHALLDAVRTHRTAHRSIEVIDERDALISAPRPDLRSEGSCSRCLIGVLICFTLTSTSGLRQGAGQGSSGGSKRGQSCRYQLIWNHFFVTVFPLRLLM